MKPGKPARVSAVRALAIVAALGLAGLAGCRSDHREASASGGVLDGLTRPQPGRSRRATSTMRLGELRRSPAGDRDAGKRRYDPAAEPRGDADVQSNWDNFNVPPGATHVLLDAKGPGVITHIWITFLGPEPEDWAPRGSADHQELMLRMFWDGDPRPAVEAPVGDFFANCFGRRAEVISLPVVVEDADSYNAYWRMPFRRSARIEIENQSRKPLSLLYFNIDWLQLDELPEDTPYFYAQYRQEYPVRPGADYLLLETSGQGHYVGSVLGVRMRSPSWFGEGDEKIFIDGEAGPSIWGTGTEDYFLSAWGLKRVNTPCFGVPYYDGVALDGHTSAYRWHLYDPVVFKTGIKVTLEHWGWISPDENPEYKATSWNEREDDYSSVAFWYQTGRSTFTERAPGADERRLPDLDRGILRGRDLVRTGRHGTGKITAEPEGAADDRGGTLIYRPSGQAGAWLEFPIEVAAKEPLRLSISGKASSEGGRYQAWLDGVKIGQPLDFYAGEAAAREFPLLDFWPDPGTHVLRLEGLGRDARSAGFACAIDAVRLLERRPRVARFGHDKDKDWRKAPVLYD